MKDALMKPAISTPCAACKLLRRRCAKECVFAPYFPPDEPQKFASVHRVFGASNVNKMLQDLPVHQRGDAVSSMVYEAHARVRDPVYGCVGAMSSLQQQIAQLQSQLAVAQAEIIYLRLQQDALLSNMASGSCAAAGLTVQGTSPCVTPSSPDRTAQQIRPLFMDAELSDSRESLWN
eukprot:Gb_29853 [translate_table: standard]